MAYLLFFSVQICFRYSTTQSMDLDAYSSLSIQHQKATPVVHTTPHKTAKHILNKRYQPVDTMPVTLLTFALERPEHLVNRVFDPVPEPLVSSDRMTALLRGPPAAMA